MSRAEGAKRAKRAKSLGICFGLACISAHQSQPYAQPYQAQHLNSAYRKKPVFWDTSVESPTHRPIPSWAAGRGKNAYADPSASLSEHALAAPMRQEPFFHPGLKTPRLHVIPRSFPAVIYPLPAHLRFIISIVPPRDSSRVA